MNYELNYDLKDKEVKVYNGHSVYLVKKEIDNYHYLKLRMHRNFDVDLGVIPIALWEDNAHLNVFIRNRLNDTSEKLLKI